MENNQLPLEFLTEFIYRNGWGKLKDDFIPKPGDPYSIHYNQEDELYEWDYDYVNEEGEVEFNHIQIYFSKKLKIIF